MSFGPGMYVFPGGGVDPLDADGKTVFAGPTVAAWAEKLGCGENLARSLVCAAVRETFEEAGVLLARASSGETIDVTASEWKAARRSVLDASLPFSELLMQKSLEIRGDLLQTWSRWITPEWMPKRFDTHFFVAAVPHDQQTYQLGEEIEEIVWLPVRSAISQFTSGSVPMMTATVATLRELSLYDVVSDVLNAERSTEPVQVRAVARGPEMHLVVDTVEGPVPADRYVAPAT